MEQGLAIGSIGISVLLTMLLNMIYNTFPDVSNRFKPWVAVFLGMGLALIVMYSVDGYTTFANLINYLTQGFMTGGTAVGMYEMVKTHKG